MPIASQKYLAKCQIAYLNKKLNTNRFVPNNITQVKIAETELDMSTVVQFYNTAKENPLTISVVISQNTRANEYTTKLKYSEYLPGSCVITWVRMPTEAECSEQKAEYERKVLVEQDQVQQQIKKFEKFIEEAV